MSKEDIDSSAHGTDYTPQQMGLVQGVKRAKTYYQMLNVPSDAPETAIRQAYKRLAFQLHPDKNHAPGSSDAFKLLGTAIDVLASKRKRKAYDEANVPATSAIWNLCSSDSDIDVRHKRQDYPTSSVPKRHHQARRSRSNEEPLSPLLVWWDTEDIPAYPLNQTNRFPVRRASRHSGGPYVQQNFLWKLRGSLTNLEDDDIEEKYQTPRFCKKCKHLYQ